MVLKCKLCGGDIEVSQDMTIGTCLYCGSTITLPRIDSEKKIRLFNRANQYRQNCEFDKAYRAYEAIVEEDEQEAEAYWGMILAEYGVEYVQDPITGKRMPTCHRTQTNFIVENSNYKLACKHADSESRFMYEDEAAELDNIQKRIISISTKENPYDVFICYKETDDATGERTQDSLLAFAIYESLEKRNIRTFIARVSLADKLGQDYEPYIYSALSTAKVMIVATTTGENCDAIWVKNEWTRFLSFMKEDESKTIIPVYYNMSPYELPNELTRFQAQDMSKVGAMQDLVVGVKRLIGAEKHDNTHVQIRMLEQENKKNRRRVNRIVAILASILIVMIGVGSFFIYQNSSPGKYKKATKKMENEDYLGAANIFSELGMYNESDKLYQECLRLANYKEIQDAYIDAVPGDKVCLGNGGLNWTCVDIDEVNDQVILLCDYSYGPMKYMDIQKKLSIPIRSSVSDIYSTTIVGSFFSEEEQKFIFQDENNTLDFLTLDEVNKYLPNKEDRVVTYINQDGRRGLWYINNPVIDYKPSKIELIDGQGELTTIDLNMEGAIDVSWAGVRPVLRLSRKRINILDE